MMIYAMGLMMMIYPKLDQFPRNLVGNTNPTTPGEWTRNTDIAISIDNCTITKIVLFYKCRTEEAYEWMAKTCECLDIEENYSNTSQILSARIQTLSK